MGESIEKFSGVRALLWPVYKNEVRKILLMALMLFFTTFAYTILRDTKDGLVVINLGAEAIPFLKFWGVMPMAIIFMLIYSKMSNILSKERLFYASLIPFLTFFILFPVVLFPSGPFITLNLSKAISVLPKLKVFFMCIEKWYISLFYIMSELWGSVALSLLFWGFSNNITPVRQAKRFYIIFEMGANLALLFSGPIIYYVSRLSMDEVNQQLAWQKSFNVLMMFVVMSIFIIVFCHWSLYRYVLDSDKDITNTKRKNKPKLSIVQSFKYILTDRYILAIVALVIGYGVAINLVEVTWKDCISRQYPTTASYTAFMGIFSFFTGLFTLFNALLGGYIIRNFGWLISALLTPIVLGITGTLFFLFVMVKNVLFGDQFMILGVSFLFLTVIIGSIQNLFSKSTKYSFFDPTKEMAYIPLDDDRKIKGKAAVDVVAARLGKSGGALIQQWLLLSLGSIAAMTPYISVIFTFVIVIWIYNVFILNRLFKKEQELSYSDKEEIKFCNK